MVGDNKYASTIITLLKINIPLENWKGAGDGGGVGEARPDEYFFKVTLRCLYKASIFLPLYLLLSFIA